MKLKLPASIIILGITSVYAKAQNQGFKNFNLNENICYCTANGNLPSSVIKLDNNWELVNYLKQPQSLSQLDSAGIKYKLSQLRLLEQWNLLKENEDRTYQTSIIILDSIKSEGLRQYSKDLSRRLVEKIKPQVLALKNVLKRQNRENNSYSILFSYVVDGMVWNFYEKEGMVNKRQITIENPFWDGEFWTLYPKRSFYCGTNALSDKSISIKINWSEGAIPKMLPFVSRFDVIEKIITDYSEKGKITDKEAFEVFGKYNLFDKEGKFLVPVIEEDGKNDIYEYSKAISENIVAFMKAQIDLKSLKNEYKFLSDSQAIVILYHEMLWDIMAELENERVINKPIAFKTPQLAKPENIAELIFIVKD